MTINLPVEVWQSVRAALEDFQRFGPGELDAEYVPEEHLDQAIKAIRKEIVELEKRRAQLQAGRD